MNNTYRLLWTALALLWAGACAAAPVCYDVTDYGAVPDGASDCTGAFQRALDAAFFDGGGSVFAPAGSYAVKGNLVVRSGVWLEGAYRAEPVPGGEAAPGAPGQGTALLAFAGRNRPQDRPFIELEGTNCGVKGLAIYYPDNTGSDAPPAPYPPCIAGYRGNTQSVMDVMLANPYEGLRFVGIGRCHISRVCGYPAKRGLYIDKCLDITRVEDCHFRPLGEAETSARSRWTGRFGVAYEFGRTDWQYVLDCSCSGYGVGYRFSRSPSGCCNGSFLGIGAFDCAVGVRVDAVSKPGLLITNGQFSGRPGSRDSVGVWTLATSPGKVSLTNCSFAGPMDACVSHCSPGFLSVTGCHFGSADSRALDLAAGSAVISGSSFGPAGEHIRIGDRAGRAVITGNTAPGGLRVTNRDKDGVETDLPEEAFREGDAAGGL
ncbi:MAG: hypothetical protein IK083_10260 [Abditibacteriota bacterium]|nr:hypothetical protein [Abditibacteriota bacterium]